MNRKPALLLIVPTLHQGGQERVVIRSARLLQADFDVTIAIFDSSDIGYDTDGLDIVNLNVPSSSGLIFKLINVLRRRIGLSKLKRRLKPEISYSYGPSANIINALTSNPAEATWCGLRNYTDILEEQQMRLFIRRADLIVCCARDIESALIRRFGLAGIGDDIDYGAGKGNRRARTCVLYNLFDTDEIRRLAESEEPDESVWPASQRTPDLKYIMTMGRDDDQKMYWHMLKVFKLILTRAPEARLLIMGAGTFDSFRRMARNLGIEDAVVFAGPQSNPYKYLKYGDIFWMTSRNEGFPNALVEAMAMGMACVSTNCHTGPAEILTEYEDVSSAARILDEAEHAREVISVTGIENSSRPVAVYGEYGILTPALSPDRDMDFAHFEDDHYNLAEVLIDLIQDDEKRTRYGRAAHDRASLYDYKSYHRRFMNYASAGFGGGESER